jgi:hypothetical protein
LAGDTLSDIDVGGRRAMCAESVTRRSPGLACGDAAVICGDLGGGEKARRSGQITSTTTPFLTKSSRDQELTWHFAERNYSKNCRTKTTFWEVESQWWIEADGIPYHSFHF